MLDLSHAGEKMGFGEGGRGEGGGGIGRIEGDGLWH